MVGDAFARLDLHAHAHAHAHAHGPGHAHDSATDAAHAPGHEGAILFIENVGNLVCPALWDLGEAAKVAILSVTEGEDKPVKYPDLFAAAQLMVINKVDLLAHVDFDIARCIAYAQRVNPGIEVLLVSARTGQGVDAWIDWLLQAAGLTLPAAHGQAQRVHTAACGTEAALRARIAELEAQLAAASGVRA
jgi:hydrogenase nickel incorporation protein HypB